MNLREYLVAVILLLAIAIGGYHYLGRLLVTTVEVTAQRTEVNRGF